MLSFGWRTARTETRAHFVSLERDDTTRHDARPTRGPPLQPPSIALRDLELSLIDYQIIKATRISIVVVVSVVVAIVVVLFLLL
jgi:hypothetical protein